MHFVSLLFALSIASFDKTITDTPGGHASAFCEPVIIAPTFSSDILNSSDKNELIVSTIKNKLFSLQKSLIKFISYNSPVEVS